MRTTAWVLHDGGDGGGAAELRCEEFSIGAPGPDDLLVEPLFGCWEANMAHAVDRRPIDICRARGEEKVVIGNAGVVRVLEAGREVAGVQEGDVGLLVPIADRDAYGYVETIHGYDAPGTVGVLAERTLLKAHNFLPLQADSRHSLERWACFSVRYATAWSNWNVALACFRAQVATDELPRVDVWGWGGGTTFAILDLARRQGHRAVMLSGDDRNTGDIASAGIDVVDRRQFPVLDFDRDRFRRDEGYRDLYRRSEADFLEVVAERTDGRGVSIFADFIGAPVIRATLRALARQGVVTTAGWKLGMDISLNRAMECIARHTHVHTHGARVHEVAAAAEFAEESGWLAPQPTTVYEFDEIPRLVDDYANGRTGYFPVFRVNR